MPLIKNAIKKLRQDQARTLRNRTEKSTLRTVLKKTQEEQDAKALALAFSALDKAVKKNLIKKGKADRLKSRLSKNIKVEVKPTKAKSKKAK